LFPYQNVIGLEFKSNYEYYGTGTATSDQNLAKGYTLALAKQAPKRCQKLPVAGRRDGTAGVLTLVSGRRYRVLGPASLTSPPDGESCCCSC